MNGFPGFVSPLVSQPYVPPCKIVPSLTDERYCNRQSGQHTALDNPICDECYDAIADETVRTSAAPVHVLILGGVYVSEA